MRISKKNCLLFLNKNSAPIKNKNIEMDMGILKKPKSSLLDSPKNLIKEYPIHLKNR